jgi:hypothetical protein
MLLRDEAEMVAIISLLVVVTISILITRVATVALTHTGLARESARFQARSAFTGAGFTTNESERVVDHPVRRRIIMLLMLMGNAGIVTAISSLILTFVHQGTGMGLTMRIGLLIAGLAVLWTVAMSQWVDGYLSHFIEWALSRYTQLDIKDYASLMQLVGDYRIVELLVESEDWIAYKTLAEAALRDEGVVVLGVKRPDGTYLGAPKGNTQIFPKDTVLLYGRLTALEALDQRRKDSQGDREHHRAVIEQQSVAHQEQRHDLAARSPKA